MVEAQRDQRIQVANANADTTKGDNTAAVEVANSRADLRSKEAEAERIASAAEKIATARAPQEGQLQRETEMQPKNPTKTKSPESPAAEPAAA